MKTHGSFHHHKKSGASFAAILIVIGILLLSVKLNVFPSQYSQVIISWQMLLIVIGLYQLMKKKFMHAAVLVFVGLFFIVPKLALLPDSFIQDLPENYFGTFWPVLLIIGGILLFLHKKFCPAASSCHSHHFHAKMDANEPQTYESSNGYIYKNSSFQSSEYIVLDPVFKGGDIQTSFGEITIDLRKTQLAEGEHVLNIKVSFGAVTIYVPQDWYVKPQIDAVFGGFEDKRRNFSSDMNMNNVLIIQGSVSFGGGELRN